MKAPAGKHWKGCHWGSKFVFDWNGIKFFGGGSSRGLETSGMDVIIDCGANLHATAEPGEDGPPGLQKTIRIQWPDGGVPDLEGKDWRNLLGMLCQQKQSGRRGDLNVLVCCLGGHGRTGTALAIFAALAGVEPEAPVVFVRRQYCPKAVETKAQCAYIRAVRKRDSAGSGDSCESSLGWP